MFDIDNLPLDVLRGISASSFACSLACWARKSSAMDLVAASRASLSSFFWAFDDFLSFTASLSFLMMAGSRRGALTLSASCAAVPGCVFAFLLRVRGRSLAGSEAVFVGGGMVVKMRPWDVFGFQQEIIIHNRSMNIAITSENSAIFLVHLQL